MCIADIESRCANVDEIRSTPLSSAPMMTTSTFWSSCPSRSSKLSTCSSTKRISLTESSCIFVSLAKSACIAGKSFVSGTGDPERSILGSSSSKTGRSYLFIIFPVCSLGSPKATNIFHSSV